MRYINFECKEDGVSPLTADQVTDALDDCEIYVVTGGMEIQLTKSEFDGFRCGVDYKVAVFTVINQ